MPDSLTTAAILECLKGLGLVIIQLGRDEHSSCWRIRTQGGPVVSIFDNGNVYFSGMKARVVRKALGLKGNHAAKIDVDALTQDNIVVVLGKVGRGSERLG